MQDGIGPGILGVFAGAIITGLFAWLVQRTRSDTDQSIAVLAEWSKLNEALSERLAAVEKRFADYRNEVAQEFEKLRKKHADEMDKMRGKHRAEMRALRELNDGLQRMIAQNSRSTAHLMGDLPKEEGEE